MNSFRFRSPNDAIVSLSSQQGGLVGTSFSDYLHFHVWLPGVQRGVTDYANVADTAFHLLDGPDTALEIGRASCRERV